MSSPADLLEPGTVVLEGRFRVIRHLAGGGMGDVYLAEQVSLGRQVALKVLRRDLSNQPGMADRFRREARLLSSVDHPAVVRVIDFGPSNGHSCLVMELAEGETLHTALANGPLPKDRALLYLSQLCEGLASIHERGIVHRDLKPENVVLTWGPRGEQARLLDFGIARLAESESPENNLSQVGTVVGTPEYLSPEQALGHRVDYRSDLYSFGVLAYRVLSGAFPLPGPTPRQYLTQHVGTPPVPLQDVAPELDEPLLYELVMRCLAKSPQKRPSSAAALASTFHALRENRPVLAPIQLTQRMRTSKELPRQTPTTAERSRPVPPSSSNTVMSARRQAASDAARVAGEPGSQMEGPVSEANPGADTAPPVVPLAPRAPVATSIRSPALGAQPAPTTPIRGFAIQRDEALPLPGGTAAASEFPATGQSSLPSTGEAVISDAARLAGGLRDELPSDVIQGDPPFLLWSELCPTPAVEGPERHFLAQADFDRFFLPLIPRFRGELLFRRSDGMLAVFERGQDAVRCAQTLEDKLWRHNRLLPPSRHLRARHVVGIRPSRKRPLTDAGTRLLDAADVTRWGDILMTDPARTGMGRSSALSVEPFDAPGLSGLYRVVSSMTGAPFGGLDERMMERREWQLKMWGLGVAALVLVVAAWALLAPGA